MDTVLERIIQIGIVTVVDAEVRKVRVKFRDTGLISDWLCVLRNNPQLSVRAAEDHTHTASVIPWMPRVNDVVLVVFLPMPNSDGFVIGGI